MRGDAALLEQVVFNLLENAHKYSPPGTPTRIDARQVGEALHVTVSDLGVGVPIGSLEKIFEKFYRVSGSDGRAPGTGLGLSICAGLVTAMGGTIVAESPINGERGTRMTVALPLDGASGTEHRRTK